MANGFLDGSDGDLLTWARSFDGVIATRFAEYGLLADDAARFGGLFAAFADAMQVNATDARSKRTTLAKNQARAAMRDEAKALTRRIGARTDLTAEQRFVVGLPIRAAARRAAVPEERPTVWIVSVVGWTVNVRLNDGQAARKPDGVIGATLFTYVGEDEPQSPDDWRFAGNTSRLAMSFTFPPGVRAGAKVWLSARWMNTRLEPGPVSQRVFTHLQGGGVALLRAA